MPAEEPVTLTRDCTATLIPSGAKTAQVSMMFVCLAYLLHTMGELCVSPVGLSYISKLAPARLLGLMFGILPMVRSLGAMEDDPAGVLRALTYQRLILVFMFLAPVIPAVMGHFLLPLQIGAAALALLCWVIGPFF